MPDLLWCKPAADSQAEEFSVAVQQVCVANAFPESFGIEAGRIKRFVNSKALWVVVAKLEFKRIVANVALDGIDERPCGADAIVVALLPKQAFDVEIPSALRGVAFERAEEAPQRFERFGEIWLQVNAAVNMVRHNNPAE